MITEIVTCAVLIAAIVGVYAWLAPTDKSFEDAEVKIAAVRAAIAVSRKRQDIMRNGKL